MGVDGARSRREVTTGLGSVRVVREDENSQIENRIDPGAGWLEKLVEIIQLHDEAFAHYSEYEGYHKSSEGAVEVDFGNVFDRMDGHPPLEPKSVGVYSYVLGPSRMHYFDSVDEALDAVRGWHREEMAFQPDAEADFTSDETQPEPLGEAPEIPTMAGTRDGLGSVSVRKGE